MRHRDSSKVRRCFFLFESGASPSGGGEVFVPVVYENLVLTICQKSFGSTVVAHLNLGELHLDDGCIYDVAELGA